ncbi:MAG: HlyD family efflux transporter periplasmic adaptor subunit [Clostridia bacterium]|nr:HlyD family efflux transporter periplasmic adaptor subunit [Clostridia bacterium]
MKKTIIAVSATAFVALIYFIISYFMSPNTTLSAHTVTYEEIANGDAFIVRDETVYTAGMDGTKYSFAKEGARVGKDRRIMSVYSGNVKESLLTELSTINQKILDEGGQVVDSSLFTPDSGSMEESLAKIYDQILDAAANNDVKRISELKVEIEALSGGAPLATEVSKYSELVAERERIETELGGNKTDISAQNAGIFSTEIDGYENVLTMQAAKQMTVAKFANIKPQGVSESKEENASLVKKGDKICKTIDNHEWVVMALVEKSAVSDLKEGDTVDIRFEKLPGEQVTATVESISNEPQAQKKCIVLLKCESFSEGAFSIRWSAVEIIKQSYSGFEVPIHAVRAEDGQSGVLVRQGASEIFKPCDIVYRDDKKAILSPHTDDPNKELRHYDMIIITDK